FTFGPIIGSISLPHHAGAPGTVESLNALPGFLASGLSLIAFVLTLAKLPESLRPGQSPERRAWLHLATLREAVKVPSIGLLLLLFFLSTFAFAQFESTLSLLTKRVFEMPDEKNFYLFSYIGLILSLVQGGLVRPLAPRIGEAR